MNPFVVLEEEVSNPWLQNQPVIIIQQTVVHPPKHEINEFVENIGWCVSLLCCLKCLCFSFPY